MAAHIRLRIAQFDKFCALRGLDTDDARARAINVDPSTLSRVLKGRCAPGERFIAGTLAAFHDARVDFADLFEVVVDDEAAA